MISNILSDTKIEYTQKKITTEFITSNTIKSDIITNIYSKEKETEIKETTESTITNTPSLIENKHLIQQWELCL